MKILRILYIMILLGILTPSFSQEWVRTYTSNQGVGYIAEWVIESYDKSYNILGNSGNYKYGLILKTDINGSLLWTKSFGNGSYHNVPINIEQTMDSGYIISGTTSKYGTKDAYILKLNSCFEKEWCKVLYTNNYYDDYGRRVKELPDGGYLLLTAYYEGISRGKRMHLHKFNQQGDLIWQHSYANSDSLLFGEEGFDLTILKDNEYLITGECYYPDSGQSGGWVRPLLIKADSSGNTQWEIIWGSMDYYYGVMYNSLIDNIGNIYSIGHHIGLSGQYPAMIKTTGDGQELTFSDLNDTIYFGQGQTITFMDDSSLFIAAHWKNFDESTHAGFLKVDTSGDVQNSREVFDVSNAIISTAKTFDNKFISVAIHNNEYNNWVIYAFKLMANLEYDTLYTTPFVYDSLCPYEITSDTTDLDCDILVLVDDQFIPLNEVKLKVIPNPARDKVTFSFPDVTHTGQREIIILNSLGFEIKHVRLMMGDEETQVDVSGIPAGIYFVVMIDTGRRISGGKLIVAK